MRELTKSEQLVADCLPEGLSDKVLAHRLGMAEGTIKVHLKAIRRKLGVQNRTQAAILIDRQSRAGVRANWAFGKGQQS